MEQPRDASSQEFAIARSAMARASQGPEALTLRSAGSRKVEAWFLGTKGENGDDFERLILEAIHDHIFWRRNFHPGDPTHISEEVKRSPDYLQAMDALKEGHQELLAFLKKSVPFFSMRYQGHMNWDLTIPGMLGYFAAMLYNPNNVAFEGSTATTILELLVGDDLCRMLGYTVPDTGQDTNATTRPWGHLTCDGTVANIEAIWASRNLKYYPLAFREALKLEPDLASARSITVKLPGGERPIVGLTTWELLNLPLDDILALSSRLATEFHITDRDKVTRALGKYSLQTLGLTGFARRFLEGQDIGDPVIFVPGSKHYSFPKAVALLGLGAANLINIPVDKDARQSLNSLRQQLELCLKNKRPVISVVAVMGTTEESAIDPLEKIIALRDDFLARGLAFPIHADAAWGGYHRSLLNDPFDMPRPHVARIAPAAPPPVAPLSAYATANLLALTKADSITVDPHKSGYIPYPAGALCYRNSAMRDLVTFSAPVVFHGEAEPTVGIYGVEGSKPGAAAAAVYLSHRVIRPTSEGYGKIIGQAIYSCRRLYARLLSLAGPDDGFIVVPVPRLPAEREGLSAAEVEVQRKRVAELIDRPTTSRGGAGAVTAPTLFETGPGEIKGTSEALALLGEIGPDENILSYAFNLRLPDHTLNTDLGLANRLNRAIYDRLRIEPGTDIYGHDLIVSTTDFDADAYGDEFIDDFKRRLGVESSPGRVITVLRSVVMDPWVTETTAGSFIDVLGEALRKAVLGATGQLKGQTFRGY